MPSWNAAGPSLAATRPRRSPTWSCATPERSGNATTCSPQPHPRLHELHKHQIRRLVLGVDLIGSRPIWPAQVGCLVGPDGSRPVPSDRLDDQTDDQEP